jgi:hypothetical protein
MVAATTSSSGIRVLGAQPSGVPLLGYGSERADANDRFWLVEDLEEPIIAESLIDK